MSYGQIKVELVRNFSVFNPLFPFSRLFLFLFMDIKEMRGGKWWRKLLLMMFIWWPDSLLFSYFSSLDFDEYVSCVGRKNCQLRRFMIWSGEREMCPSLSISMRRGVDRAF